MKVKSLFLFLILSWLFVFNSKAYQPAVEHPPRIYRVNVPISSDSSDYLLRLLQEKEYINKASDFEISHRLESPVGLVITFQQKFNGFDVLYGGIKLLINDKKILQIIDYTRTIQDYEKGDKQGEYWVQSNNLWRLTTRKYETDHREAFYRYYAGNELIYEESTKLRYSVKDTSINVTVFNVNPLKSAKVPYGGRYRDFGDTSNQELDNELIPAKINAKLINDTFYLSNEYLIYEEITPPVMPSVFSLSDTLMVNRSHHFFETINASYHLNNSFEYLKKLGFENLLDTMKIDANAYYGTDNSSYNYALKELEFGTGFIDDAEDGEVVIHELSHALSTNASPNTVQGAERRAIEEGNADYWAMSYSRFYHPDYNVHAVFSWDMHNEFDDYDGFVTNANKIYDKSVNCSPNSCRELWSQPMICLFEKLGKSVADSIFLSSLYIQAPFITMQDMAFQVLLVDSILYNKKYKSQINRCFHERKIIPLLSIDQLDGTSHKNGCHLSIKSKESSVEIETPSEFVELKIYDITGRLTHQYDLQKNQLNPIEIAKKSSQQLYILKFKNKNGLGCQRKIVF